MRKNLTLILGGVLIGATLLFVVLVIRGTADTHVEPIQKFRLDEKGAKYQITTAGNNAYAIMITWKGGRTDFMYALSSKADISKYMHKEVVLEGRFAERDSPPLCAVDKACPSNNVSGYHIDKMTPVFR